MIKRRTMADPGEGRPDGEPADPVSETSPEELARASRAGSEASYAALVNRFQNPLYQFLLLRTRSAADAEELAHETFVRAWRNLARYDDTWRFSTWLYTIARREAVSFYRRQKAVDDTGDARIAFDPRPEPIVALSDMEGRSALWGLARRVLNHEQFDALWLRYAEDLTPREIAAAFDRDASGIRVLLFRARRILAQHLHEDGAQAHAPVTAIPMHRQRQHKKARGA